MPNSNSAVNNLLVGLNIAGAAQADADAANRRAHDAEMRAMQAEMDAAGKTTDRDLQRRLDEANSYQRVAEAATIALRMQVQAKDKALAEKDAMITEWMHSNEAFKRLARQYGKKLGVSDEQRQINVDNTIIDVAEEDPKFQNTELNLKAKARAGKV